MTFEDVKRIRQNPTAEDCDNKELSELIDIALEKQIPKKPINIKRFTGTTTANCSVCNGKVLKVNYCQRCGQALDWGDTE